MLRPTEGNRVVSRHLDRTPLTLAVFYLVPGFTQSVRTHMVFVTGARSAWNEDHIISRLPPRLQERVLEHVHRDAVLMIPILKTKPPSFVAAILRNLRPRQYSQVMTLTPIASIRV